MSAPIYFLHGFLGMPSMWREVHRALGEPVAGSGILPGHGPEPWFPPEPADFSTAVDALARAFPFSEPSIVVGYSMGARVLLSLALRHPGLVRAAVLVGADPGIEDESERAARAAWDDEWAERSASSAIETFADAWETLPIFDSQRALPPAARASLRRQRTSHTPQGIAWAMRALGTGRMPSQWSALAATRTPLAFVTGSRDAKFTGKSKAICDRAPAARSIVVEGAGHNVVLEAPEAVARAIEEVTKGNDAR